MNWFKKTFEKLRLSRINKNLSYAMAHAYPLREVREYVEKILMDEQFWSSDLGRKSLLQMFMQDHVSLVLDVLKQHPTLRLGAEEKEKQALVEKINDLVECLKKDTEDDIFKWGEGPDILKINTELKVGDSIAMQKFMAQSKKSSLMNMYFGKINAVVRFNEHYYFSAKEKLKAAENPDLIQAFRVEKAKDICKYIYEPYLEKAQLKAHFDHGKEAERLWDNMLLTQMNAQRMPNQLKAILFKKSMYGLSRASKQRASLYGMSKFWSDAEYLDKEYAYAELKTYFSKQLESLKLKDSLGIAIHLVNKNIPEDQRLEFCKKNLGVHYSCLCLIERDWGKVHQFFDVHSQCMNGEKKVKTMVDFLVSIVINQDINQYKNDEKEWKDLLSAVFAKEKEPRKLALEIAKTLEQYNDLGTALKSISLLKEKVYMFTVKEVAPTASSTIELKPPSWRF